MICMSAEITLIAYVSIGGSTEEYANAIYLVFKDEYKMQVDLVDLRKNHNPDLTKYRNVVVGTGIRIQRMHSQGARFLEKDYSNLAKELTKLEKEGIFESELRGKTVEELEKIRIDKRVKRGGFKKNIVLLETC